MVIKVNVSPLMIKWAREDAGFSLDELPQSLNKAEKWEAGEEKPTFQSLKKGFVMSLLVIGPITKDKIIKN